MRGMVKCHMSHGNQVVCANAENLLIYAMCAAWRQLSKTFWVYFNSPHNLFAALFAFGEDKNTLDGGNQEDQRKSSVKWGCSTYI